MRMQRPSGSRRFSKTMIPVAKSQTLAESPRPKMMTGTQLGNVGSISLNTNGMRAMRSTRWMFSSYNSISSMLMRR